MDPEPFSRYFTYSPEVSQARRLDLPLVALESAVITHGLPHPENLNQARDSEAEVRAGGAVPATIALLDGRVQIGLTPGQIERLAHADHPRKISSRDFAFALAAEEVGGTTVAASLFAARHAGLHVFATGGIGGVHRGSAQDVSADLPELARSPLVVVCSGAKSILDLPATLEVLETSGVPVIGYATDEFPAFYSAHSGLATPYTLNTPQEIALLAHTHWEIGQTSALLVVNPPPRDVALPTGQMEAAIQQAVADAARAGVHGSRLTPYLLQRVAELTGGASLRANLALLRANARLAAEIAVALSPRHPRERRI